MGSKSDEKKSSKKGKVSKKEKSSKKEKNPVDSTAMNGVDVESISKKRKAGAGENVEDADKETPVNTKRLRSDDQQADASAQVRV